MKRNQLNNHGSVKHSFLNLKTEQEASTSASYRSNTEQSEYFESPYKGSLSEIKQISYCSDDDFKISKPVKKQSKVNLKKPDKKTRSRNRSGQLSSIQKCTRANFKNSDVNPDHLQMAIALSNSTLALEYPERFRKYKDPDLQSFLCPDKIPKKETILERYGFKSNKIRKESETIIVHKEQRHKNSKFRFITPILQTRNDEDRQSLIQTKISLIISQQRFEASDCVNIPQEILHSLSLQLYHCHKKHIFNVDSGNYYCASLGLPFSQSVYGCLLRDWNQIPGRDSSPEKNFQITKSTSSFDENIAVKENTDNVSENTFGNLLELRDDEVKSNEIIISDDELAIQTESVNCASPDLFESDIEKSFLKSPDNSSNLANFSNRLLENDSKFSTFPLISLSDPNDNTTKEFANHSISESISSKAINKNSLYTFGSTDSGIEYFESFCNDSKGLSKAVFDLVNTEKEYHNESKNNNLSISLVSNIDDGINSSSSFALSTDSAMAQSESFCKGFVVAQDFTINKEICQENQIEQLIDLTQSSNSNESSQFTMLAAENHPGPNDYHIPETPEEAHDSLNGEGEICIEDKFNDDPHKEIESSSQFCMQEGNEMNKLPNNTDIETETVNTINNSEKTSNRVSAGVPTPRLSSDMYDYNCSNSLNVTDYVTNMLNSQPDDCEIEENPANKLESVSQHSSFSQTSIIISDEELNYSSLHSTEQKNEDFYNLSRYDENYTDAVELRCAESVHKDLRNKYLPQSSHEIDVETEPMKISVNKLTNNDGEELMESKRDTDSSLVKVNQSKNISTPQNNIIVKTQDVTPMANYDKMDTPKIRKELDKFGFKPLKRQKGIKLLKYIYESTHPFVLSEKSTFNETEDAEQACKKRRTVSPNENRNEPPEWRLTETEFVLKDSLDDLIFERRPSKIPSCRLPLQLAWYNFVFSNPQLHNNILLYEPLHLEVTYSMFKEQSGCEFHLDDLITFLDKKCITFRTTQNKSRRNKKLSS